MKSKGDWRNVSRKAQSGRLPRLEDASITATTDPFCEGPQVCQSHYHSDSCVTLSSLSNDKEFDSRHLQKFAILQLYVHYTHCFNVATMSMWKLYKYTMKRRLIGQAAHAYTFICICAYVFLCVCVYINFHRHLQKPCK